MNWGPEPDVSPSSWNENEKKENFRGGAGLVDYCVFQLVNQRFLFCIVVRLSVVSNLERTKYTPVSFEPLAISIFCGTLRYFFANWFIVMILLVYNNTLTHVVTAEGRLTRSSLIVWNMSTVCSVLTFSIADIMAAMVALRPTPSLQNRNKEQVREVTSWIL